MSNRLGNNVRKPKGGFFDSHCRLIYSQDSLPNFVSSKLQVIT